MQTRLGPGPVFVYEWLTTSRRWQLYALRAVFVGAILVGMIFVSRIREHQNPRPAQMPRSRRSRATDRPFFLRSSRSSSRSYSWWPPPRPREPSASTRVRGTLDHMLATDLSNGEIVLGKLGVRLVPVLGLVACVLPIMALAGLLGGIDPNAALWFIPGGDRLRSARLLAGIDCCRSGAERPMKF